VILEADAAAFAVTIGARTVELGGPGGRHSYSVETPDGLQGLSVVARSAIRLYRITGFTPAPDLSGPDGPVVLDAATVCS
jgi:hypothetical protein